MRFFESDVPKCAPDQARFHVLPVPYEKTVSYGGGTKHGPGAILKASSQLERWDGLSAAVIKKIVNGPLQHGAVKGQADP